MATTEIAPQPTRKIVRSRDGLNHQLHLYIGLFGFVFLLCMAVTGALLAFREPIDRALNASLTHVQPVGQPLPLSAVVERVQRSYPDTTLAQIKLPERSDAEIDITLRDRSGQFTSLAVDPYSGTILGNWERDGNRLVDDVLRWHKLMLFGGDALGNIATIAMLMLSITGLVLWNKRRTLTPRLGSSSRVFIKDAHSAVGLYSFVFVLVFSLTALYPRGPFMPRSNFKPVERVSAPGPFRPAEELLAAARAAVPGATPVTLRYPQTLKNNVIVTLRFPNDHTGIGRTQVQVDPYSGKVLGVLSSEQMTALGRFSAIYDMEIHAGTVGGMPTRVIAALAALAMLGLTLTGPIIWWQARRAQRL